MKAPSVSAAWSALDRLAPPVDIDGPRVRLGLVWGAVTLVLAASTSVGFALLLAGAAMAAAGQTCVSWKSHPVRPWRPVAVIGAALVPLAALAGWLGAAVVVVGVIAAALVGERAFGNGDAARTAATALGFGLPMASLVLVRGQVSVVAVLVALLGVHLWDASAFIVGSGASNRWEGPLAATATTAALGLLVAAVLVPPFRGWSPLAFAVVIALATPAGRYLGSYLLGDPRRSAPVVRRVDGLLVAAPAWAVAATVLLG